VAAAPLPGFSIVLPTLWPYLREMNASTRFLAAVIAAYSVGEGCGGAWATGSPRVLIAVCPVSLHM